MQSILGVDMTTAAAVVVGLFAVGLTAIVVAALRSRLLLRLAVRNVPRRPFQSALISLGLALATIIVTTALTTGDTLTYTVRSLVAGSIGRADEVIVKPRRDPRRNPLESAQAVASGTFLTGTLDLFDASEVDRLRGLIGDDPRIAGIAPAIVDQVVATSDTPDGSTAEIRLFGLPRQYPAVFGALARRDGQPIPWADTPETSLVLNDAAASLLGVSPGDRLTLTYRDQQIDVAVSEVARNGDPAGIQPTAFMPLDELQRMAGLGGQINQILLANQGDPTSSVRLSTEVARAVRPHLIDDAVAGRLFTLLRSDAARAVLNSLIPGLEGRERDQIDTLRRELDYDEPSVTFKALIADPEIERRLLSAAGRAGAAPGGGRGLTDTPGALRLIEVKRISQELADRWGAALSAVFVVLGLFSLATGSILVVLIFVLLAAERRTELGALRALGATRRQVTAMLLYEGLAYDLMAAGIGLLIGAVVSLGLIQLAAQALSAFGIELAAHVEPQSLLFAYCLGAVITMASIVVSAWRSGRLTIVAAIKDLSEPARETGARRSLILGGALLVVAALAWWLSGGTRFALPAGASVILAALGVASLLRPILLRAGLGPVAADRARFSVAGGLLLAYWLTPDDLLAALGWVRPLARSVDLFFVAGLSLVFGAVLILASNLQVTAGLVRRLGDRRAGGGLLPRLALTFPTQHPGRTGLTVAMFGLVVFSMVVASVLLTATHRAYTDPAILAGGYDIRVEDGVTGTTDFRSMLSSAPGLSTRDLAAVGTMQGYPAEGIQPGTEGTATWRTVGLSLLEDEFTSTVRAGFSARATGYADDAAIWQAVREQPGLAIAAGPLVRSRLNRPPLGPFLALSGVTSEETRFAPVTVWVRDSRAGRAVKLIVIGVLDPRAMLGSGLFTSRRTFDGAGIQPPTRTTNYLRVAPEVNAGAVVTAVNVALSGQGIRASEIGEDVRRIVGLRTLLNQLLQTFMGVGLLAGVAGLGVLSARAVVERRQQIGVLRALGFTRRAVQTVFLLESSVVALLGIGIGVLLGLGLASRLVAFLGREFPEIIFSVPWGQIGGIAAFAYVAALALTFWPAWRAGRVEPSSALRYE